MRKLLGIVFTGVATVTALFMLSAGQALARTVVCGDVITQDTTLDSDLIDCPGDGLVIGGDNITLDLNGHTISGQGSGSGVSVSPSPPSASKQRITVTDGVVENFAQSVSVAHVAEAFVRDLTARGGLLECKGESRCTIDHNTVRESTSFLGAAIAVSQGAEADIHDNVLVGGGIFLGHTGGEAVVVDDNRIENAPDEGIAVLHATAIVSRNVVRNSGSTGIEISSGHADVVANTFSISGASGICVCDLGDAVITGNVVKGNGGDGITTAALSLASIGHNVVSANRLDGVNSASLPARATIFDNHADRNGRDGVHADSPGTTLTGNHAWFNGNLGIEAVPSVTGSDNWAKHNGNPLQCVPTSLCRRRRKAGKSLAAIAEELNRDEVPTAHGGAKWYPSTVRAILAAAE